MNYSIGIVTYLGRYDKFFCQLIASLSYIFPDKDIVLIINGHYDQALQLQYLKKITNLLLKYPQVRYFVNDEHQSLAKCWNRLLLMANNSRVLILNDDLSLDALFRFDLEQALLTSPDFFIINDSFSHFLISSSVIKHLGWFDERFLGVGSEDGDYVIRMHAANFPLTSLPCRGIINFAADQPKAGWANVSQSFKVTKYTAINFDFMAKKWLFNHLHGEDHEFDINFIWKDVSFRASLKAGMATPVFYDYSLLPVADLDPGAWHRSLFFSYLDHYFKKIISKIKSYV